MSVRWVYALALMVMFSTGSALSAPASDTADQNDPTFSAPVALDGDVLLRVRGISSFPAHSRAKSIRERILVVAREADIDTAHGTVVAVGDHIDLKFGDQKVLTLYSEDAELEGVPLLLLGESALTRIGDGITRYREMRSPQRLLRNTGIALGVTALAALLAWGLKGLFGWLNGVVERRVKRHIDQLEQASHRVIDARQLWGWVGSLLNALRILVMAGLVLAWLNITLGLYPWTQPLAREVFQLVLNPLREMGLGIINALPDLAFLAVLTVVVRFVLRVTKTFFERVHRGWIRLETFDKDLAMPTYRIVRVLVIVFGLVIAYPYIPGSGSEAFKGMSIFFGVVLSIGSSSFIANIIAGYSLTYRRAFREGDRVKIGDIEGVVVETRTLNTRIKSLKNEEINVPNSMVLGSAIVNYTTFEGEKEGLILHSDVGIGYDTPWRQVEAMLLEAATRTEGLRKDPPPFVLQRSLQDFAVIYQLNAYCSNARSMNSTYSQLHGNIQDVFNKYGVQIMSPHYIADTESAKLVPPEQWYPEPAKPPSA